MAYTCNVCDKEFEHAGGRNLHQRWCKLLQLEKENGGGNVKIDVKGKGLQKVEKKEKHEHNWVLLGNTQAEKLARQNGYTKYCSECEEIE